MAISKKFTYTDENGKSTQFDIGANAENVDVDGKPLPDVLKGKKRTATLVVGSSTAGYTADDVDYLCTGTSDHTVINNAIAALPTGGGKIVLLEGTYNISGAVLVNKDNVTLEGMGNGTVLKRMFNNTNTYGLITVTSNHCVVTDLCVDGNHSTYSNTTHKAVSVYKSSDNIIQNVYIYNESRGVYLYNGATGNIVSHVYTENLHLYGIDIVTASQNEVVNCVLKNGTRGVNLWNAALQNTVTQTHISNMSESGIKIAADCQNEIISNNVIVKGDDTEYSIQVSGKNNLVVNNQIIGMNYTDESNGTTNTFDNNMV